MKASLKNKSDSTWFVAALEEEFSSDKHNVLYTGMGKINAAFFGIRVVMRKQIKTHRYLYANPRNI